ncbi:MAG: endonuclease, partial [Planctomycetota bacterium]
MPARSHARSAVVIASLLPLGFSPIAPAHADPWAAPASYYSGATGTGSTLKSQLRTAMSTGHIQRTYGNFRDIAALVDADPNNIGSINDPGNIILVYDGVSVDGDWDSGVTWNREHVWPQSRQPGSASNSSTGNLGDPHALRPATPLVNSARSNKPFGFDTTTGSYGSLGSYWFPGDGDKGDIARSIFYSDTRWSSLGLSLTDSFPSGNQMGDLSSMIAWNYADAPSEFERRRNHAIASRNFTERDGTAQTNFFFTNNRNAFVDMPWVVHSIYVDQANDSTVSVGGGPASDGSSSVEVLLGRVFLNGSASGLGTAAVTVNKAGDDGTYFDVQTSGGATSDITGQYNNFALGGPGSRVLNVGLDTVDTSTTGLKSGQVTIDNLDVTTQGGAGNGANDANDTIHVGVAVVSQRVVTATSVDLGTSIVGYTASAFSTLSTTGSDDERTRVTVGNQLFDDASDTTDFFIGETFTTAGNKSGTQSFAVTGEGLTGEGSYSDVQVAYTATALDPSNASFASPTDADDLVVDFGIVALGSNGGQLTQSFDLFNLESTAGFTADLDLDAVTLDGSTGAALDTTLAATSGIQAGSSVAFDVTLDTSALGDFSAVWGLDTSDEDVAGETSTRLDDAITATGLVTFGGDANLDFEVNLVDLGILATHFGGTGTWTEGDFTGEGDIDVADLEILAINFGLSGTPVYADLVAAVEANDAELAVTLAANAIPEPATVTLLIIGVAAGVRRRTDAG